MHGHRNLKITTVLLTLTCTCIANIFAQYNQQYATFLNLCISVRRSTCLQQQLDAFHCAVTGREKEYLKILELLPKG